MSKTRDLVHLTQNTDVLVQIWEDVSVRVRNIVFPAAYSRVTRQVRQENILNQVTNDLNDPIVVL